MRCFEGLSGYILVFAFGWGEEHTPSRASMVPRSNEKSTRRPLNFSQSISSHVKLPILGIRSGGAESHSPQMWNFPENDREMPSNESTTKEIPNQ